MGRAEVQPSVNVLMRADPIVHYTIAFTVTGHQERAPGRSLRAISSPFEETRPPECTTWAAV